MKAGKKNSITQGVESSALSTNPSRRQSGGIIVGNEDRATKVRTISKELAKHRDCREISRALIAPVNALGNENS